MATGPVNARNIHLGVMCLAGLVLGVIVLLRPAIAHGTIHPFFILILVSLALDVGIAMLAAQRPVTPLSMYARAGGFFSGVIIYLLVVWVFAAGPQTV